MRTVVVLNQFALPRSEAGGTRHVDLFGRLPDWQVLIVAGDRNHYSQRRFRTDDRRFRLVRVPAQGGGGAARLIGWIAYAGQALAVTLRAPDASLVVGSSPQPLAALAGLVAARLRGLPFVLEVRDLWPESLVSAGVMRRGGLGYRVFRALERVLARQARRIVCVTSGWERHFGALGVADRLVVVPNGTEPSDFAVPTAREALRAEHRVSGFTAVFAGAHGPKDGLDQILDAAGALPEVRFLLVGSGPAKPAARERAIREGLGNVEFREPLAKQHLAGLLRACDVGVHAVTPLEVFQQGMSPNKLFDYLAAGLPVVSNAGRGLRSVLGDRDCGVVGPSDGLAAGLRIVRDASPAVRERWRGNAERLTADRFSRTAVAAELARVLDELVVAEPQRVPA